MGIWLEPYRKCRKLQERKIRDLLSTSWSRYFLKSWSFLSWLRYFFMFYGPQRFITAFTGHSPLFVPIPNHINRVLALPSCFLNIHLNIILPSMLRSFKWSLHQIPVCTSPIPHMCHMPQPSHSSWFDHLNGIASGNQCIEFKCAVPEVGVPLHLSYAHAQREMKGAGVQWGPC